ncbi:MAG: hypothetical protein C5B54_00735 [Acidobacteria bacterium]|nr:MAG: hypothetical protein C5B54_00735 [Acidobacteriota bacterium]
MYQEWLLVKWFIDKSSKIPLYLQLKALITHYVSTGMLKEDDRLPTVKQLASELGINFETVRKAYKDLDKEGLLSSRRGTGTFASGHANSKIQMNRSLYPELEPVDTLRMAVEKMLKKGISPSEIQKSVGDILNNILEENSKQFLIFTECNQLQIRQISEALKTDLRLNVHPVLLNDLREKVERFIKEKIKLLAVVTTGFHVNEVRHLLSDLPVNIDFVITNMSTATRRAINELDKKAQYGLICRDPVQMHFFKDLVKEELGIESEIISCVTAETLRVEEILNSVDVLLVSPPVYEEIKAIAPLGLPIFNVLDRIDPISLSVLKQRLRQLS